MGTRFAVEFEGITLRCVQDDDGDITARTDLPSGLRLDLSFEDSEVLRLHGRLDPGKVDCAWVLEEDLPVLNRLTYRATVDIGEPGRPELRIFWRPESEVAAAIRAAAPIPVTAPAPLPDSVCPACGAGLVPRGAKLWCDRCRLPVETCCDGGRNPDTR